MTKPTKPTSLETSIRKTLFFRRFFVVFAALAVLVAAGLAAWFLTKSMTTTVLAPPSYEQLDPQSVDYWKDRTQWDIDSSLALDLSPKRLEDRLRQLILTSLNQANKFDSGYERNMAIGDIAMTVARNNIDVNIDDTLRKMDESDLAWEVRARINISRALMYIRLKNRTSARVSLMEYNQILVASDLKLDSIMNDMSFCGAVTAYFCLEDTSGLNDLFNRQLSYTLRVDPSQQMKAYRFIAGEQARVGFNREALQTLLKIQNPVELARACQLVIAYTARPQTVEPNEPVMAVPKTEGPWTPLPNPTVSRHIVDEVLRLVAGYEVVDDQIQILLQIAGSRLMCDPEIHGLFKTAVRDFAGFEELVKRPVLKLLNDPESEIVRKSLGMPPRPTGKIKSSDPALDDWTSPLGSLAVDVMEIDPVLMKAVADQQAVRALNMIAQSYLLASRRRDADPVLQKSLAIAKLQTHPIDRIRNLLSVAELQLNAGDSKAARATLKEIGLPVRNPNDDGSVVDDVFTEDRLSNLARLQIIGRYFDDALATIAVIRSEDVRNDDYTFLAQEQIRIRRFEDARRIEALMSDGRAREELQHRLAIAAGGGEEHYTALGIPYPETAQRNSDLVRCCEALIRRGLFDTAEQVASRITNSESQSKLLARIAREYMLLFNAYKDDDDFHRTVRNDLSGFALKAIEAITEPEIHALVLETVVSDMLPYARQDNRVEFLRQLLDRSVEVCRGIESQEAVRAELLSRLISEKIILETAKPDQQEKWPLIDREHDRAVYDSIKGLIDEALALVNDSEEGLERGLALSALARAAGQIGRTQSTRVLVRAAEESAGFLSDKSQMITVLLSLVTTMKMLGEREPLRLLYGKAFTIASDSFVSASSDGTELTLEWRIRDTELDRIVRSQIEQDLLVDAVDHASRINEAVIRDRLLRTAAYIYLDHGDFETAETIARKITVEEMRTPSVRDVLFMKRAAVKKAGKPSNDSSLGTL